MLRAAQVFSSNMVLQRDKNVALWGQGEDGRTITAEIAGQRQETVVRDGRWAVTFGPMEAADGLTMRISDGTEEIVFTNVAVGEVWFCGGQSNMELELQNAKDGAKYLAELDENVPVRYYYTPKVATAEEAEEQGRNTAWGLAGPESSKAWSAVGFHFAKKLSEDLGVIVGLIGCNWGGTSASSWVDRKTLENDRTIADYLDAHDKHVAGMSLEDQKKEQEEYSKANIAWDKAAAEIMKEKPGIGWGELEEKLGKNPWPGPMNDFNPFRPTNMYENMVMRVCPYTIKGFLYYQGESDDHRPDSYYRLFTALIGLWRESWGDDTLPFIMVQLPMHRYAGDPDYKHWCRIRDAQMKAFRTVKNTGIAVILDCGEFNEIHPKDKLPVGERLCLQAEKLCYGMEVSAFGPIFRRAVRDGGSMVAEFDYAEEGFDVRGGAEGFEIAGEDGEFVPAKAEFMGSSVRLSAEGVEKPFYIRYCYTNYGEVHIFGMNGIPMAPFTTYEGLRT
ncbi:MAG: sialate O-acetylesterase [Ruminococcus sp.]|nr:sialate O-acetylesterase [Ruminococcus sp.]